jgi:hypothetical protein
MRKRTRITVVAAALLLGLVAPTIGGAAGNDQAVLAGMLDGRWIQRVVQGVRVALGGSSDDLARGVAATLHLSSVIDPVVTTPAGRRLIPTAKERAHLYQLACQLKTVHDLDREQEAAWRLMLMAEQIDGAVGYAALVVNLTRELEQAEDNGDRAWAAASTGFCIAADANLKHYQR